MLVFESLDEDAFDRAVQPVNITEPTSGYINQLNAMSNRLNDTTLYSTQKRRSSFSAQIRADASDREYSIEFTGTAPEKMQFKLLDIDSQEGVVFKIVFKENRASTVKAEGAVVAENDWDDTNQKPFPLTKNNCGENRQEGVKNVLEVFIKKNCLIEITPREAIKTKLRMEWTLQEFYAEGGTIRFAERVASALGIEPSRIKTVNVYEGSVIVDFFIEAIINEPEPVKQLTEIKEKLVEIVTQGIIDLGAPVLGLMGDDELLVGDPIPEQEGVSFTETVFNTDSSAIVKDANLWDEMVNEKKIQEQKKADYDKAKQRNSKITKTITKVIENSRFKETPVRKVALAIILFAVILVGLSIYLLCKCLQRNERMLEVQVEAKAVQKRKDELVDVDIEPQLIFGGDDSKIDFARVATPSRMSVKSNMADETSSPFHQHRRSVSNLSIASAMTTQKALGNHSSQSLEREL